VNTGQDEGKEEVKNCRWADISERRP